MRLNRFSFLANENAAIFCKESFVFTCPRYKKSSILGGGWVHEFYGLKASQMSKVCASSHNCPHVEKLKNLCEQNFKGETSNKQLDSEDTQQSDFSN